MTDNFLVKIIFSDFAVAIMMGVIPTTIGMISAFQLGRWTERKNIKKRTLAKGKISVEKYNELKKEMDSQ